MNPSTTMSCRTTLARHI